MMFRPLGSTGISVSAISFGAGPVSGLLTSKSSEIQHNVIAKAIELGINWFDTAATYGAGQSEANLGEALSRVRTDQQLHVATKVRVIPSPDRDLRSLVVQSVKESLARLQQPRVTLLQIHNSITFQRNDQPTSITPEDVLGPKGLLEGMEEVRTAGLVDHFGLTGIGDADALRIVIRSGRFATIQAPFHLLNPSTLCPTSSNLCDPDYGGFLRDASELGMGLFAIRVFAAGALLGAEPSAHTLQTPFFPLALYRRDRARADFIEKSLASTQSLKELALRFVLTQSEFASAIIGFGDVSHVEDAVRVADLGSLADSEQRQLNELSSRLTE